MGWRFDTEEVFDDDYLFFYADMLTDEVNDGQAELIWRLLELEAGAQVRESPGRERSTRSRAC